MAELARTVPVPSEAEPEILEDDESVGGWVQRWVRQPNGSREFQEFPLTPEYFLDPKWGDQTVQGLMHGEAARLLANVLDQRFPDREDVLVLTDVKLLWGHREWRRPVPDVALVQGIRDRKRALRRRSFNVAREGVRPSLIIEVVSDNPELRRTDHVDKKELYEREKIPEYLLLDLPRSDTDDRFQWTGYRLDAAGRYQPIEPDEAGRLFSEVTGLWFGLSPDSQQIWVTDAVTGERLLTPKEEEKARKAAEAELTRLREEIARLKGGGE
jgi:Uma2 family endonuclease